MPSPSPVRSFLFVTVAVHLSIGAMEQVSRPDFSGRWTLGETTMSGGGRGDASGNATGGGGGAGGGTGLGPPAGEVSIQQNDSMLIVAARRDGIPDTIRYRFDGKPVNNFMPVGRGGTVHTTYRSRWSRARLETTIVARARSRTIRYRELLYLTSDSALVVETDVVGRLGGRKVVYRKTN